MSFWLLGFDTKGSPLWVFVIAVINAVLGVGLGLLASAFARTEFQAVQFMPVFIVPQLLLAGIIVPRNQMPTWLEWISNAMPASYALEALQQVNAHTDLTSIAIRDIFVVLAFAVVAMALLRRPAAAHPRDRRTTAEQTSRTATRHLGHPRPDPDQRTRVVRPQRYRQDVDPIDRRRRGRRLRSGAPLLRHKGGVVRRGDQHSDRPPHDRSCSAARHPPGRGAGPCAAVDPATAVGFRDGRRLIATMRSLLAGADISLVRSFLQEVITAEVAPRVDNPPGTGRLRVQFVASQLVGVVIARYIIGLEPFASLAPEQIAETIAPTLQRYLTGELPALS